KASPSTWRIARGQLWRLKITSFMVEAFAHLMKTENRKKRLPFPGFKYNRTIVLLSRVFSKPLSLAWSATGH
ncbi:MAG: hypothetical protein AABZ85_09725, partial [Thermodesulfobacteriota bacterium]